MGGMYVAGQWYRGSYKKPQMGQGQMPHGGPWEKAQGFARVAGQATGFGSQIYSNWEHIAPFVEPIMQAGIRMAPLAIAAL